jgi:hypothetical protein
LSPPRVGQPAAWAAPAARPGKITGRTEERAMSVEQATAGGTGGEPLDADQELAQVMLRR